MGSAEFTLEVFTDPMMGLTWEQQPTFRKLETHFPSLRILPRMCVLVDDVYRFCDPNEIAGLGRHEALKLYLKRLAQIYLDEEAISNMPIVMDGFDLFSDERTSSRPLCLAYEAAVRIAPDLAAAFLYRLRFATVAECRPTTKLSELSSLGCAGHACGEAGCRPTTKLSELSSLADDVGIDGAQLLSEMKDPVLNETLGFNRFKAAQAGAHGLPHSVVTVGGKSASLPGLSPFERYAEVIETLSGGKVKPVAPADKTTALSGLLQKRLLISDIEIMTACDTASLEEARSAMERLEEEHCDCNFISIKDSLFISMRRIH